MRRIVAGRDPALVAPAHEGGAICAEVFDFLFRRQAARPNAICQVDHTPLKIRLRGDDGAAIQPWLTIGEDDFSRCGAGHPREPRHRRGVTGDCPTTSGTVAAVPLTALQMAPTTTSRYPFAV
jgi:hypothetical protein